MFFSDVPTFTVNTKNAKGEDVSFQKRVNLKEWRKSILDSYLAKYDEKNLRFLYFQSTKDPRINITVVSNRHPENNTLDVAFSFCSINDGFSRREGKITCFEHLETKGHPFVVTVPWLKDGLLSVYYAYNEVAKPIKLACTNFSSLYFTC